MGAAAAGKTAPMEPMRLTDEQQAVVTAVTELEVQLDREPTLGEIADHLGWARAETREVVSGLLSHGADLLRELTAAEPDSTAYTVKAAPTPE